MLRYFKRATTDWMSSTAIGSTPAKGNVKPDLDNIIRSVESAIDWAQKIEESDERRQHAIGYRGGTTQTEIEELKLDDYAKFVNELKQSLTEYARDKSNALLMEKANLLITDESDFNTINADLNTILLYLKSEQNHDK